MMTAEQILRQIESGRPGQLLDRLLNGGRCHSRLARAELRHPDAIEAAAIGMGLQRVCELTYWASPAGSDLAHRLLRLQRRDGLFGRLSTPTPTALAASAVALRGVIDWLTAFGHRDDEHTLLRSAIERGLIALARSIGESAHREIDSTTLALVLWQLGECDMAAEHLDVHAIRQRVAASDPELLRDDLTRLALTMAA